MNKTQHSKFVLIRLLVPILFSFFLSSAVIAQQNTVSSGGMFTGKTGAVSFSIGQIFYKTHVANNKFSVNEGVQQSYIISNDQNSGGDETGIMLNSQIEALAYPNPTQEMLNLFVPINQINGETLYKIYGVFGDVLQKSNITEQQTIINMNNMKSGTYFVEIIKNSQTIKVFKIIKN